MNGRRSVIFAGVLALLPKAMAQAPEKTAVVLGTATPGGGFPVFGAAFAETVNGADASLLVQTRNTKGSTENIPLIEAGSLDIALVTGEPFHEAVNGIGRPPADLKIIAAMYSSPGMFFVRADSPQSVIAACRRGRANTRTARPGRGCARGNRWRAPETGPRPARCEIGRREGRGARTRRHCTRPIATGMRRGPNWRLSSKASKRPATAVPQSGQCPSAVRR